MGKALQIFVDGDELLRQELFCRKVRLCRYEQAHR